MKYKDLSKNDKKYVITGVLLDMTILAVIGGTLFFVAITFLQ